jgi:hypothetical protein
MRQKLLNSIDRHNIALSSTTSLLVPTTVFLLLHAISIASMHAPTPATASLHYAKPHPQIHSCPSLRPTCVSVSTFPYPFLCPCPGSTQSTDFGEYLYPITPAPDSSVTNTTTLDNKCQFIQLLHVHTEILAP